MSVSPISGVQVSTDSTQNIDPSDVNNNDNEANQEREKITVIVNFLKHKLGTISKPVSKSEFPAYVQKSIESGELKRQYESIPEGQYYRWDEGQKPNNYPSKHRYDFSKAYDHNRVILKLYPDETSASDYVNANYIDGFHCLRKFVATQAPIPTTLDDHWRMIWDSNAGQVVTLTKLVDEDGKVKCEKYWPDEVGSTQTFGNQIEVELVKLSALPELDVRHLRVKRDEETREVIHYHFLGWPDNGTPSNPSNLLRIITLAEEKHEKEPEHPIVVHCSAGVGRTGTFILLHTVLDMAKRCDYLDVWKYFAKLRTQRVNAIETLDQYIFVHVTLKSILKGDKKLEQ